MKLLYTALVLLLVGCVHNQTKQPPALLEIYELINDFRQSEGLESLLISDNLNCAASVHALDIGFYRRCDDIGTDNSTFMGRGESCHTRVDDQIIACGFLTPDGALDHWIKSIDVQALTDPQYTLMGCGMHNYYWVCTFSY